MCTIAKFGWPPICIIFAFGLVGHQYLFHGSYTYDRDALDFTGTLTWGVVLSAAFYVGLAVLPWIRSRLAIFPAVLAVGALAQAALWVYVAAAFARLDLAQSASTLIIINVVGFCGAALIAGGTFGHAWGILRPWANGQPDPDLEQTDGELRSGRKYSGSVWRTIIVSILSIALGLTLVTSIYVWRLLRTEMSYHIHDVTPRPPIEAIDGGWLPILRAVDGIQSAPIELHPLVAPSNGSWVGLVRHPFRCSDLGCQIEAIFVNEDRVEVILNAVSHGVVLEFSAGDICISTKLGFDLYSYEVGKLALNMSVREGMDCLRNPIGGVLGWLM